MFNETIYHDSSLGDLGAALKNKNKAKPRRAPTTSGPLKPAAQFNLFPKQGNVAQQLYYDVQADADAAAANQLSPDWLPSGSRVEIVAGLASVRNGDGGSLLSQGSKPFSIGGLYLTTRGAEDYLKSMLSKDFASVAVTISKGLDTATIRATTTFDFTRKEHAGQNILQALQRQGFNPSSHRYRVVQLARKAKPQRVSSVPAPRSGGNSYEDEPAYQEVSQPMQGASFSASAGISPQMLMFGGLGLLAVMMMLRK